jgi:glycosyltransferase involved in cell wall biosynthesis
LRLAVLTSHPIQYYAPLFRELARRLDLHVFYAHEATPQQQAAAGFGIAFDWDVDLLSGYSSSFLKNVAARPGVDHFAGCDTPEVGARLREGRFDALLLMGWHLKSLLQGLAAAKRIGLPVMIRGDSHLDTLRSTAKRTAKRLVYPTFLRLFNAALYVGRDSRAYYRHYGYPEHQLFSSPHCVDTTWFADRATASARAELRARLDVAYPTSLLLFAGKLVSFKRPLDVVAAAARLNGNGHAVELMVAGSGELAEAMEVSARDHKVTLHMLGFQNQSAMPAAYAASDLLVLPSDGRETWGLVANEALACGRPIAVSNACGCARDLADGAAGTSFPLGDITALADTVSALLEAPPGPEAIAAKSALYSLRAAADGNTAGASACVQAGHAGV